MKVLTGKLKIRENVSLAPLTTLGVGGSARYFVAAQSEKDIIEAVQFADENDLPLFVLGGGSNILVSDAGFNGLVLKIDLKGIERNEGIVKAQAGEDWDQFVRFCVERDLQGVECLSGIPGLTGGTPVQNVGAYGQDVSETVVKVRAFDRRTKQILELSNTDCKFAYRASIFNTTDKNRFIVLAVTFNLKKDGEPKIVYKDLRDYFGESKPTLEEVRRAVLEIRRLKSMVIDEGDPNSRSAGSFFKNPIVSEERFKEIQSKYPNRIPYFPAGENLVKIPAAWLIENSGFPKGFKFGNAGLSANHTLAIISLENARSEDVIRLKDRIQAEVQKKHGIELAPEPVFIGF